MGTVEAWMRGWTAGGAHRTLLSMDWGFQVWNEWRGEEVGMAEHVGRWPGSVGFEWWPSWTGQGGQDMSRQGIWISGATLPPFEERQNLGDGRRSLRPNWSSWTLGNSLLPRPALVAGGRMGGGAALGPRWSAGPRIPLYFSVVGNALPDSPDS